MITVDVMPFAQGSTSLNLISNTTTQSPTEIRIQTSQLVAMNNIVEANALSKTAITENPYNEELLVNRALVCEIMHLWVEAAECLKKLLKLQGREAPAVTWQHYVRVLRSGGNIQEAIYACKQALRWHSNHTDLIDEHMALVAAKKNSDDTMVSCRSIPFGKNTKERDNGI